jgi:hypothetical protein
MAIAPAFTALILVVITVALVPSIAIGGSSYNQILVGKDFQSETAPPKLYIVEIHNVMMQMAGSAATGQPDAAEQQRVDVLRRQYEAEYQKWDKDQPLTDAGARASLEKSHDFAEQYLAVYDHQLLPLFRLETTPAARARYAGQTYPLLNGQMIPLLQRHQAAILAAAAAVDRQVSARERDADSRVR